MMKVILDKKNKSKNPQIEEIHSFNDGNTGYRIYQYIEDIINSPYNEKKKRLCTLTTNLVKELEKNIIFNNYN